MTAACLAGAFAYFFQRKLKRNAVCLCRLLIEVEYHNLLGRFVVGKWRDVDLRVIVQAQYLVLWWQGFVEFMHVCFVCSDLLHCFVTDVCFLLQSN